MTPARRSRPERRAQSLDVDVGLGVLEVRLQRGRYRVFYGGRPVSRQSHAQRMDAHAEFVRVWREYHDISPTHDDGHFDIFGDAVDAIIHKED